MDALFPFKPADDASPADWIVAGLQGFAESVLSIVPAGFEAYARVYHPAYRRVNEKLVPVRWAEIAAATGRIAHRQMQFPHITSYNSQKQNSSPVDIWDEGINEGHLPKHLARSLWRILKGRTITSERCWFAVWEGWGSFGVLEADIFAAPAFEIPGRRLHLFSARIEAAERSFSVDDPFFGQLANLWWPDDRAWCVVTEIDFNTTYVGGSQKAIAALVQSAELEADIIEPSDGVQWASDTLNPLPKDS